GCRMELETEVVEPVDGLALQAHRQPGQIAVDLAVRQPQYVLEVALRVVVDASFALPAGPGAGELTVGDVQHPADPRLLVDPIHPRAVLSRRDGGAQPAATRADHDHVASHASASLVLTSSISTPAGPRSNPPPRSSA